MDAREKLLGSIEERLTVYANWVNQGGGIRSDGAEYLYCNLLNTAFGYALGNMNRIRDNYPAIDLGDEDERLAVQVTSTGDAAKVRRTLERFYAHKLNEDYDRLIVLIAGKAECRPSQFDHPGLELEVWGTAELVKELRGRLSMKTLREVEAFLLERVDAPKVREPVLSLPIGETLGVDRLVGRQQKLEEMSKNIATVKPLVLSGLGGMGKTELARQFGAEYRAGRVFFAQFRGSFEDTVADSVAFGIPGMEKRQLDAAQRYALAMEQLQLCGENDLLIVDNVDRDGCKFADLKDETYKALCKLPMRLLLTTRHEVPGAIEVDRIAEDELYKIFGIYGVADGEEELKALIRAVDRHTMTVDLMARTMVGGWKPVTPGMLLETLGQQNLNEQPYEPVETDYNREGRQGRIYDHLRAVFNVVGIPEAAKAALRCAVLLPEGGMELGLFGNALPEKPQSTLNGLLNHGWLQRKGTLVTIHPMVRLVCRTELKPTDENCRAFLHNIGSQYDKKQYNACTFRQMAEMFENAANTMEDQIGFRALDAGYLWFELADMQKALEYSRRAAEKLAKYLPGSKFLATAYNNIGAAYNEIGNYDNALSFGLKAKEIRERVLSAEHPDLAITLGNIGTAYSDLGEYEKALGFSLKALAIQEKILPSNHPNLVTAHNNVGAAYRDCGDYEKALEHAWKALEICEKDFPEDYPGVALCYSSIGSVYRAQGNNEETLKYVLKALNKRLGCLPANHPDIAISYNNVARTYYLLGQIGEAATHMRRAADTINRSTLPETHPDRVNYNKWAGELEREYAMQQKILSQMREWGVDPFGFGRR